MNNLQIELDQDRVAFEPGEELRGSVCWKSSQPLRSVELRLFWFTRGKGTEDAGVVETVHFDQPSAEETCPFHFQLPEGPYSFSGKLISLVWALELIAQPSGEPLRVEFVMAPGTREVRLESLPEPELKKAFMEWSSRG
jgi:hypothetical protein